MIFVHKMLDFRCGEVESWCGRHESWWMDHLSCTLHTNFQGKASALILPGCCLILPPILNGSDSWVSSWPSLHKTGLRNHLLSGRPGKASHAMVLSWNSGTQEEGYKTQIATPRPLRQDHLVFCTSWESENLCGFLFTRGTIKVANKTNTICLLSHCLWQTKNFQFPRPKYV